MIRALLWKEWREQRAIAFAGAGLAVLIPVIVVAMAAASRTPDFRDTADVVPFLFAMVVWPLFAALAGATVNAEGASPGSAAFLFSRPVPRGVLWLIKVCIGVVALSFVVTLSFYAALRVDVWVGGWGFRFPFSSDPFSWPSDRAVQAMALGGLGVTFCAAIFLSTFLRRPAAAAIGGLAIGIASQFGAMLAAVPIPMSRLASGVDRFLLTASGLIALVLLAASLYLFLAAGLTGTADGRRDVRRAGVGIVAALPLVVVLAGFSSTRLDWEHAQVRWVTAIEGTDTSIVRVFGDSFSGSSLWSVAPGRQPLRLTGRMASGGTVSADGEWLVYVSTLGILGTRSANCDVRAVRLDGREDRRLALLPPSASGRSDYCSDSGVFDPAGEWLATRARDLSSRLALIPFAGGDPASIDLGSLFGEDRRYRRYRFGWISNGDLAVATGRDSRVGEGLWRIDPRSGEVSEIYRPAPGVDRDVTWQLAFLAADPPQRYALLSEWKDLDRSAWPPQTPELLATKVLDLTDGSAREVAPICRDQFRSAAVSPDGRQVFYSCSEPLPRREDWETADLDAVFQGTLVRRDLTTGTEITMTSFDSRVAGLYPSPDFSRFVVRLQDPRARVTGMSSDRTTSSYALIEAGGRLRPLGFTPDWSMADWSGNDRLVLRGSAPYGRSRALAYLEIHADSVELRPFFQPDGGMR